MPPIMVRTEGKIPQGTTPDRSNGRLRRIARRTATVVTPIVATAILAPVVLPGSPARADTARPATSSSTTGPDLLKISQGREPAPQAQSTPDLLTISRLRDPAPAI